MPSFPDYFKSELMETEGFRYGRGNLHKSFPDYFKSELMETQSKNSWAVAEAFPDYFKSELMETLIKILVPFNYGSHLSRLLQIGINGNLNVPGLRW